MAGKTNDHICMNNSFMGHIKILAGRIYIDYSGDCKKGHMGEKDYKYVYEATMDLCPWFQDVFDKVNRGKSPAPKWLVHRVRWCLPSEKDELLEFQKPRWAASWELVDHAITANKVIHPDDIYAAQERQLVMDFDGLPGVYIGWREESRHGGTVLRIGMSKKGAGERFRQHEFLRPLRLFSTTQAGAPLLESELKIRIVEAGGTAVKLSPKDKTNSHFAPPAGMNMDEWLGGVAVRLRHFFHNTQAVSR